MQKRLLSISFIVLAAAGCSNQAPPPNNATMVNVPPQPAYNGGAPMYAYSAPAPQQNQDPFQAQPQQQQPQSQAASQPTLQGTLGGRQFIGRSALMVVRNAPFTACSSKLTGTGGCSTATDGFEIKVSTIRIYEHVATCDQLVKQWGTPDPPLQPGEHSITVQLQATYPVASGSMWKTDSPNPKADQLQGATFHRQGNNGGAVAKGSVQFNQAGTKQGVMTVQLAAMNQNLPEAGTVSGSIPFTVCN